jgi:tetratricopeptide (TPR) repeat protein
VDDQNQFDDAVKPNVPAPPTQPAAEPDIQPWNLVPVTAAEHARGKRRLTQLITVAVLLVLGLGAWIYKRSVDPIRALEAFDAGERLLKSARYTEALTSFDRAIALDSAYAEAYAMRGRTNIALARPLAALPDYATVIELHPKDPQAYLDRGSAHIALREWPEALVDFNRALELDANLAIAYNLRGATRRAMGDPRKALADFTRAVELLPNMDNFFQRGATYQLLGEHEAAITDFSRVISFEPASSQGYFARSQSFRALGDAAAANRDHRTGRILDGR